MEAMSILMFEYLSTVTNQHGSPQIIIISSNQFQIQLFDLQPEYKSMLSTAKSPNNILGLSAFVNSKAFSKKVTMITA